MPLGIGVSAQDATFTETEAMASLMEMVRPGGAWVASNEAYWVYGAGEPLEYLRAREASDRNLFRAGSETQ
jgi:hypothetical protein